MSTKTCNISDETVQDRTKVAMTD